MMLGTVRPVPVSSDLADSPEVEGRQGDPSSVNANTLQKSGSNNDLAVIQEIARIAQRGKFDLLFVSDGLDYEQGDLPSFMCRFEPTSLISVLSAHTTRLGLGATVSTSFTEPTT